MPSAKQVRSEQGSMRVEPSTDEQAYDALDGKAKYVDIYYLMKGGESYTIRELMGEIEVEYQTTSKRLNEMEDRGVVTYEKDGKTKIWFLDNPYREYESETIIEKRTVVEEKEVSPYDGIGDFLFEEYRWMTAWSTFVLSLGVFLLAYKYVFYDFYPTPIGSLPEMVTAAAFACLLTVSAIALNEVDYEW